MIAYTREQLQRLLRLDFIRFCIVGGTGFVINLIILTVLHHGLKLPIFLSQLIGAEVALFSNFMLHHRWTYRHHNVQKSHANILIQFHATSWPAIFGSAAMVSVGEKTFHLNSAVALIISSVIVLIWNFVWSKYVIWRHVTSAEIKESIE